MDNQQPNTQPQGEIHPPEATPAETELEKLRKERDEYLAGWQRAKADLSNYKKEEMRRQEAFLQFAAERFLQELLPVLDSLDLAILDAKNAGEKAREQTLWLIASQLLGILKKQGLEVMATQGKKFDANFHESVEEVTSGGEPGMIVEEVQKGYLLNGRGLRPARVKVSKS